MMKTALAVVTAAVVALPAPGRGDVVRLKDGSTLKGRVLSLRGDTLTVRTSFGSDLRVPRASVAVISFSDTLAPPPAPASGSGAASAGQGGGTGQIAVMFKDRDLSSKVVVVRGKDEAQRLRANWIELVLVVDDQVVYTAVDSTMDKTIYNGPERVYKNDAELEDFEVELPAGMHHIAVVVRNRGGGDHDDWFDGEPLELMLPLDNTTITAGKTYRVKVGISRGRLRMGAPSFERIE
jgi:hypothetical protein